MTLQLTGKNEPKALCEPKGLYQDFYGSVLQQMPILIDRGTAPISIAGVIGRRESAPADVIDEWRYNCIFTGDGIVYGGLNNCSNAKIVLDAALLREVNSDTSVGHRGGIKLSFDQWYEQWNELRGDNVLDLDL